MNLRSKARIVAPILIGAGTLATSFAIAPAGAVSAHASPISASSFTRDFSAMTSLKSVTAKGSGLVAAILPDTVSSARYTEFDAPYLTEAFTKAGLSSSEFTIQNAQGSDSTELTDAQADIAAGATVLVMDPLDSGVGAQIEKYAK